MASILSAGTTTATSMVHTADTSGVLQLASNNGTVAVTIDTNQGVGLNGSVSSEWASSGILQINNSAAYSTLSLATTRSVSSGNRIGSIVFDMPNNTATYRSRAEIECDMIGSTANKFGAQFRFNTALDNATGLTTGLVVNPYGIGIGGSATPSSGTGIAFPATQNASSDPNTLDDYEEGTWTPSYYVASGVSGVSYLDANGWYVKVGKIVTVYFRVNTASISSASGSSQVYLAGLPFGTGTGNGIQGVGTIMDATRWGSNYPITFYALSNNTQAGLIKTFGSTVAGSDPSYIVASDLRTGSGFNGNTLQGSLTYYATA